MEDATDTLTIYGTLYALLDVLYVYIRHLSFLRNNGDMQVALQEASRPHKSNLRHVMLWPVLLATRQPVLSISESRRDHSKELKAVEASTWLMTQLPTLTKASAAKMDLHMAVASGQSSDMSPRPQ